MFVYQTDPVIQAVYSLLIRLGEPCHEQPRQNTSERSNPLVDASGFFGTT